MEVNDKVEKLLEKYSQRIDGLAQGREDLLRKSWNVIGVGAREISNVIVVLDHQLQGET